VLIHIMTCQNNVWLHLILSLGVCCIFLQSMMTLAVIMGGGILHKNETHPKLGVLLHCQVCCAMMTQY